MCYTNVFSPTAACVHPVHRGASAVCEQEGGHHHQPRGADRRAGQER